MILSHRHRFIYIKLRKVAGSSTEAWLGSILGPEDVKIGSSGGVAAQNALSHPSQNHAPWRYVRDHWPREWELYFTWCVERNPWDKMVSYYWHSRQLHPDNSLYSSFKRFCMSNQPASINDWGYYTDQDQVQVDQVVLYHELYETIPTLGIPGWESLKTHQWLSDQRPEAPYHEYYDDESRLHIQEIYAKPIQKFNFQFD